MNVAVLAGPPQILTDVPLAIDPDEVLRFQGYKRGIDVAGPDVMALFDAAHALGDALMRPRALVRWMRVTRIGDDGLEAAGQTLAIPGIAERWGHVESVAVGVCTIGETLEDRVRALWEAREFPLAVMLDSVGSAAAESLAEYVNDLLCQQGIPLDLTVTNRISPGYGNWDVGEQARLFRLVSGEAIGVRLNGACFMTPEKSLTLLVGAGPDARVDHDFSQCARCWMAACAYRRVPAGRVVRR